jgi:hypothetical protein
MTAYRRRLALRDEFIVGLCRGAFSFLFCFCGLGCPHRTLRGTLEGRTAWARGLTAVRTASQLDTRLGGTESEAVVSAALFVATLGRFSRPFPGHSQPVKSFSHWTSLPPNNWANGDT